MKQMFSRFFFLSTITLVAFPSFSQDNYQTGYYINNNLDSIKGFIDYREWVRNPITFKFKKALDQKPEVIGKRQARAFGVSDETAYERYYVTISQNEVNLDRQSPYEQAKNDTVFLERLAEGSAGNLYRYKDNLKTRYYLGEKGSAPYELIYEVENSSNGPRISEKYRAQLHSLAARNGKLNPTMEWQLKKISYGTKSLVDIVNNINGIDAKKINKQKTKGGKSVTTLYLGTGLNRSDLMYKGGSEWTRTSTPSYSPYLTLGMNYVPNASVSRYSLRAEASFSGSSFHTVANNLTTYVPQQIDYTFNQFTSNLHLVVNYSFYQTSKMKVFGGAGARVTFATYSNNNYTITTTYTTGNVVSTTPNFFDLASTYYSFILRGGIQVGKKMEWVIEYDPSLAARLNNYTALWTETMKTSRVGFNYFF